MIPKKDSEYMGVEPKNRGKKPLNHPFVHRVFHYIPSILGVFPLFLETPTWRHGLFKLSSARPLL